MGFSAHEINTSVPDFGPVTMIPGIDITPTVINMKISDNSKQIAASNKTAMNVNVENKVKGWDVFFKSLYNTNQYTYLHEANDSNISIYLDESDAILDSVTNTVGDRIRFRGVAVTDVMKAIPVQVLSDTISMVAGAFKHISNREVAGQVASNIVTLAIYLFVRESAICDMKVANSRFVLDNKLRFFVYPMLDYIFNIGSDHA